MVARYLVPVSALCIGFPVMVFVLPRLLIGRPTPDAIGEHDGWKPTLVDITQKVGVGPDSDFRDARHHEFAAMFQQRFRANQKAVGVSFKSPDLITAKFAATIPRWDMAQVAIQLHDEAKAVFGKSFHIDIFETYISMDPIKLAELRDSPDGSKVSVWFDRRFAQKREKHPVALVAAALSGAIVPRQFPNPMYWMWKIRLDSKPPARLTYTQGAALNQVSSITYR